MIGEFLICFGTGSVAFIAGVICVIRKSGVVFMDSEKPSWKRCADCEGCGVLTLQGPIPLEYRTWYRQHHTEAVTTGHIQGPIANTQICLGCQGVGHTWQYDGGHRVPQLPRRSFFHRGNS